MKARSAVALNVDPATYFTCDPERGLLWWRPRPASMFQDRMSSAVAAAARWNGKIAGRVVAPLPEGRVVQFEGMYAARSHIIWHFATGGWPSMLVDHIDGDRGNDSFSNLREVDYQGNARNRAISSLNTSGHIGVHWCKRAKRWLARITVDGRKVEVGRSRDYDQACEMWRNSPLRSLYHQNHGRKPIHELRGLTPRADADVLSPDASAVLPLVPLAGHVAAVAGGFFDDRSRDGETYSFGSEMQVGGVHATYVTGQEA